MIGSGSLNSSFRWSETSRPTVEALVYEVLFFDFLVASSYSRFRLSLSRDSSLGKSFGWTMRCRFGFISSWEELTGFSAGALLSVKRFSDCSASPSTSATCDSFYFSSRILVKVACEGGIAIALTLRRCFSFRFLCILACFIVVSCDGISSIVVAIGATTGPLTRLWLMGLLVTTGDLIVSSGPLRLPLRIVCADRLSCLYLRDLFSMFTLWTNSTLRLSCSKTFWMHESLKSNS